MLSDWNGVATALALSAQPHADDAGAKAPLIGIGYIAARVSGWSRQIDRAAPSTSTSWPSHFVRRARG